MTKKTTRRTFLKNAAALSAGLSLPFYVPSRAFGRAGPLPAGERVAMGFIGLGGMGSNHLGRFLRDPRVEILAVCDVDERPRLAAQKKVGGSCAAYKDFRMLLDRGDIDAVVVATPDHWHTLAAISACRAGKDVYCEKPLTLTIEEARVIVKEVRRTGRVFQVGSQQRSSPEFRRACEMVRNGMIGKVDQAFVGISAGPVGDWVADEDPPPELDWNLWLGPAPRVPYNRLRHPYNFRWFFDYSGGKMTDWGAHHNDIVQWGFDKDGTGPATIEGEGTFPTKGLYDTAVDFAVTYTYADGRRAVCSSKGRGIKFVGSDGWVHVDRGFLQTEPASLKNEPLPRGAERLFKSPGHHANWLDCIRSRERPICDVEIGAGSVIVCHLCNIALRTGRRLEWDPEKMRFRNDPEMDRWLSKPYRAPWRL